MLHDKWVAKSESCTTFNLMDTPVAERDPINLAMWAVRVQDREWC